MGVSRSDYKRICEFFPDGYIVGVDDEETSTYRTFDDSAQFLIDHQCGKEYKNKKGELGITFSESDFPDDLQLEEIEGIEDISENIWYFIRETHNTLSAVIIACSRKYNGYCVAAYNPISKKIVRFVSDAEEGGEISREEMEGIRLLDTVEAETIMSCPIDPQTENVLVEQYGINRTVKFNGSIENEIENIRQQIHYPDNVSILDTAAPKLNSVQDFHHSLEIVKVEDLSLTIRYYNHRAKTLASFWRNGLMYTNFRVTDPEYERLVREKDNHQMTIPSADIVLSIPAFPYEGDGMYYKFVAAIYELSN